jgi:hypothetical protein
MVEAKTIILDVEPIIKTNLILSSLSFLGCLTIILLFSFRKNLRSFVFSLVFFLAISELLNSIGNILSINKLFTEEKNFICELQSWIIIYTDFCSLTWMCIISYTIHDLMINYNQNVASKRKIFIFIGFGTPLIFCGITLILYFLGLNETRSTENEIIKDCWCWISDIERNWIYVIIFYFFYWFLITINFIVTFRVIKFLKSNCEPDDKNCEKIKQMCNKLYVYPLISAICFLFATVHRMYEIFYIKNQDVHPGLDAYRLEFALYLLHGIFITFRGFLFFIVYGCDKKVRKEFSYCIYKMKRIVGRKKSEVNEYLI